MSTYEDAEFYPFDCFTRASLGIFDTCDLDSWLHAKNSQGWTPLMYACSKGYYDLVTALLLLGAERTHPAFIAAVQSGDLPTVKALYTPEKIENKDKSGWTALSHAVFLARESTVQFLLDQGADIHALDVTGLTPLSLAQKFGLESIVKLLLRKDTTMDKNKKITLRVEPSPKGPKQSARQRIEAHFGKTYTYSPGKHTNDIEKENPERLKLSPVKTPSKAITPVSLLLTPNTSKLLPKTNLPTAKTPIKRLIAEHITPMKDDHKEDQIEPDDPVYKFLKYLNLTKYWPTFRDEEVDFDTLLTFEEGNLADIGIRLYGPKHKILVALERYKTTNKHTLNFLNGNKLVNLDHIYN